MVIKFVTAILFHPTSLKQDADNSQMSEWGGGRDRKWSQTKIQENMNEFKT